MPEADAGVSYDVDPEYLEFILRRTTENGHARRKALDTSGGQPDLPWDA